MFMADISMFEPEMIVWLDETGSDRRNSIRAYGYGLRGLTPITHKLQVWGKRITAIGVMSMRGIEDAYIYEGSVNGDVFEHFVRTTLLPLLMSYNGVNTHSVVVMDNATIHHLQRAQDMILGVGALIRFLPAYSPDLNPIEEVFSKVKRYLKANDTLYLATQSPHPFVLGTFHTVTQEDCINYIKHASYC